jgi:hypothetical protein
VEVPLNCHKVSFRSFNRSNVYTARFLNCQHVIPFLQSFKRVHFVRYAAGCGKTFNLELACKALNIFPVVMSAVREGGHPVHSLTASCPLQCGTTASCLPRVAPGTVTRAPAATPKAFCQKYVSFFSTPPTQAKSKARSLVCVYITPLRAGRAGGRVGGGARAAGAAAVPQGGGDHQEPGQDELPHRQRHRRRGLSRAHNRPRVYASSRLFNVNTVYAPRRRRQRLITCLQSSACLRLISAAAVQSLYTPDASKCERGLSPSSTPGQGGTSTRRTPSTPRW